MPPVTKMNEDSIKRATGQFDLETVFKLSMQRMSIKKIENLSLCPSLTELDLSNNRLTRMEGLDALDELKRLNLSANSIDRIENVGSLNSLETLQLQGNQVANLDEVQALSRLPCLRTLSFKLGDDLRNPLCEHPGYYTAVRRMLPRLASFDGERTVLVDAAAPEGNPFDSLELPTPTPWLKDFKWDVDEPPKGEPLGGAQEFEQVLTDCKRLSARAQSMIDDYRAQVKS